MIINNNIPAVNTHRQMGINQHAMQHAMEKLSSGMRINRAGDDAAGLAISEKMRAQVNGLHQASRNTQDGITLIQTAEGALQETHAILQRMRELAVQSANDTNTNKDRAEIQKEVNQLVDEIDRIANTTEFNTKTLLDGSLQGLRSPTEGTFTFENNSSEPTIVPNSGHVAFLLSSTGSGSADGALIQDVVVTVTRVDENETDSSGFEISSPNAPAGQIVYFNTGTGFQGIAFGSAMIQGEFGTNLEIDNLLLLGEGESITLDFKIGDPGNQDSSSALSLQIGANTGQTVVVGIDEMSALALGVRNTGGDAVDLSSSENASAAITTINDAIEAVSDQRSDLGAFQNRLEHTMANLNNAAENLSAAESRIRDVDMAAEMMEITRANLLSQASQSMLAQANQQPQSVVQLLG